MHDLWHVDSENYRRSYYDAVERAQDELPSHVLTKVSVPEAIALPNLYLQQRVRLLVIGQETYGSSQAIQDCKPYDAWSSQIGGYIAFDYAEGGDSSQRAGKFWRAFDEIRQAFAFPSKRAMAWTNILKVQLVSSVKGSYSISKLSAEDRMAIVRWQRKLFEAEMAYIKPNVILFLTGSLDWVAFHMFDGHQSFAKDTFRIVKAEGLDIPMVQTSHPNSRRGASVGYARADALKYLRAQLGLT